MFQKRPAECVRGSGGIEKRLQGFHALKLRIRERKHAPGGKQKLDPAHVCFFNTFRRHDFRKKIRQSFEFPDPFFSIDPFDIGRVCAEKSRFSFFSRSSFPRMRFRSGKGIIFYYRVHVGKSFILSFFCVKRGEGELDVKPLHKRRIMRMK